MSAKRAWKSRPCSTPRRCQPVRFAPATNWPSRSASSATTSPSKPDRPERAGIGAERGADLLLGRGAHVGRRAPPSSFASSSRSSPRTSASTTVPSSFTSPASPSTSPPRRSPSSSASASIVVTPGVSTSSRRVERAGNSGAPRHGARDLEVGREVAVLAGDERVLARARRREEVDRLAAAHHPRLGLRPPGTRARSARRSGGRRRSCARKLSLEPLLVAVERVRVLHDELAHAEEAAARPRLVAVLRLEVVPGLRQLLVALDLARVEGERLLVRQRQDEPPAGAVLQRGRSPGSCRGRSPPTARPASAPARTTPARRSRPSPRG